MNKPLTRPWIAALGLAGWMLALGLLAVLAWAVWQARSQELTASRAATAAWRASVADIRECRRRGPRPMVEWQVCEDQVLAAAWRSARP